MKNIIHCIGFVVNTLAAMQQEVPWQTAEHKTCQQSVGRSQERMLDHAIAGTERNINSTKARRIILHEQLIFHQNDINTLRTASNDRIAALPPIALTK